ncbi:MAG: glycosyltransferase family 2 protein [Pseudomonadales bacterium]|nr:glycosyltransferase family 2 protein [Pseudomonadales bacterium]
MTHLKSTNPLVSIGVPVFNEEQFIRESLESLVNQTYGNIELIISDNCSTDGTSKICKEFEEKYEWISYNRFEENIGASPNFKYVLEQATGKYFMWAAGHDLWSANYLSECVKMLEPRKNAAIAFGSSKWINANGTIFGREYGWIDTRGMGPIERFFVVFWGNMHPILGLIRTEFLKSDPITNTVGVDLIILTRLALLGDFVHAVEAHWSRREFRTESTHDDKLKRYKSVEQGFTRSIFSRAFPLVRLPLEITKVVFNAKLPAFSKISLLFLLLPSFITRYFSGKSKRQ